MARSMRSSVVWRFGAVAVLLLALPIDGTDNSDSDLVDLSSDGSDASTAPATSVSPTTMPSVSPTTTPSVSPTTMPSVSPTGLPSVSPTGLPSMSPSASPTLSPSLSPTLPSSAPSTAPQQLPFIETVLEGGKLNFEADLGQFMVGLTPVNVVVDTFDAVSTINATQGIEEVWEPPVNSTDLTPSDLTSASVGPVPSLFLLGCVVGLAATAMVTIKRRRAASADCSTHEDMPLYTDYPRYS